MELMKIPPYPGNPNGYFEDISGKLKTIDSNWINEILKENLIEFRIKGKSLLIGESEIKINENAIKLISAYVEAFERFINCSIRSQTSTLKDTFFLPFFNENLSPDDDGKGILGLNAEWIRHMNSLFFKKTREDHKIFFPYNYQDHICHSFVVTLLGKMFINSVRLNDYTLKMIISSINKNNCRVDKFNEYVEHYQINGLDLNIEEKLIDHLKGKNLLSVINFVYFVRGFIDIFDTEIGSEWSVHVWEYIGLWHDSGYDNYTFSFLLDDSFSHNKAISHIPISFYDCLSDIKDTVIDNMNHLSLSTEYKTDFMNAYDFSNSNGKNIGEFIKKFEIGTNKNYGRAHALFAGFEFQSRYNDLSKAKKKKNGNLTQQQLNLIVYAIIEHHEKHDFFNSESELIKDPSLSDDENQINQTVDLFVRNPLGHLLRLCDSIAGFARIDIDWSKELNGGNREIKFEYDSDKKPVEIKLDIDRMVPLEISVTEEPCGGSIISKAKCDSKFNYYLFAKVETIEQKKMNSPNHKIVEANKYHLLRPAHHRQLKYIIKSTRISIDNKILEIGCGTGNQIAYLQEMIGCCPTGMDRDINRIQIARKKYPKVNFILSDIYEFDTKKENLYDLILLSAFIQNIDNLTTFFEKIARIVPKGSFIAIITTTPKQIKKFPEYRIIPGLYDYDKKRFWEKVDIIDSFSFAGFKLISCKYTTLISQKYDLDYFEYVKSKPYSAMYNIAESDFNRGLLLLKEDILQSNNKKVNKNGLILIAQK